MNFNNLGYLIVWRNCFTGNGKKISVAAFSFPSLSNCPRYGFYLLFLFSWQFTLFVKWLSMVFISLQLSSIIPFYITEVLQWGLHVVVIRWSFNFCVVGFVATGRLDANKFQIPPYYRLQELQDIIKNNDDAYRQIVDELRLQSKLLYLCASQFFSLDVSQRRI